jgi:hypothetical protein
VNIPYVQCELRNGDRRTTTWVPRKWARKGKELRLKRRAKDYGDSPVDTWLCLAAEDNMVWEIGWIVEKVGNKVVTGSDIDTIRDEYRFHRRRTDV